MSQGIEDSPFFPNPFLKLGCIRLNKLGGKKKETASSPTSSVSVFLCEVVSQPASGFVFRFFCNVTLPRRGWEVFFFPLSLSVLHKPARQRSREVMWDEMPLPLSEEEEEEGELTEMREHGGGFLCTEEPQGLFLQ